MNRYARDLAFLVLGLLLAIALASKAQPYVGAALGISKAYFPDSSYECDGCVLHDLKATGQAAQIFFGYQSGRVAIEAGGGTLSSYRSHNIRPQLPSDIQQEINTSMVYVRGLAFTPARAGWRGFVSGGMARVTMRNHEFGRNDPSLDYVDQLNYDVRTRPLLGAGLMYDYSQAISFRLELTRISDVAVSHWTLQQDVTSVWLGLVVKL